MKFSVDERVRIVGTDIIGIVVQTEYKFSKHRSHEETIKRYFIMKDGYYSGDWYQEHQLESTYELADGMLEGINKLLIDVHLKEGKYNMVKLLADELYGKCSNE